MSKKSPWKVQWWDDKNEKSYTQGCATHENALMVKRQKERAGFCSVRIIEA